VTVTVRLFAILRDRAGRDSIELRLPEGATVADALRALADTPGLADPLARLTVRMAVNRDYADAETALASGDELALVPPVSGGAGHPATTSVIHARITERQLSVEALSRSVVRPGSGAVVTFQGVTREVDRLDYEAYAEMAERQIAEIVAAAIERHGLCAAAAEHRIGRVPLGEPSVIVAASAPHRAEAFAGAREIIDAIKSSAPIWKAEEGEWVEGSPPPVP
jgi:molybdopterin synthase catalytic subunit